MGRMTDYVAIACGDYDYLEIACLDRYEIELTCGDEKLIGIASGMEVRDGSEFICLEQPDGIKQAVRVDRIEHLTVVTRPARFHEHHFANSN